MSVMTQLGASLRFVELPAVVELLASAGSTGRLRLACGDWAGEIVLRRGQIVGAALGDERGLAALEGIALGFNEGELKFADGPVAEGDDALLATDEQVAYLQALNVERQRLEIGISSLHLVPRLVESSAADAPEARITVGAAALRVLPQLLYGHSMAELARQRGLARTLRDMSVLGQAGVVRLEATPARGGSAQREAPTPVVPVRLMSPRAAARTSPARPAAAPPRPQPVGRVMPTRPFPKRVMPTVVASPAAVSAPPAVAPGLSAPTWQTRVTPVTQKLAVAPLVRTSPPAVILLRTDEPRRAALAGWCDALARLLRPGPRGRKSQPLFEPRKRAESIERARSSRDPECRLPG